MANDVQLGSKANSSLLVTAMKAWSINQLVDQPGSPVDALAILDGWMVPLKDREPAGKPGKGTQRVAAALKMIGAKIAPTMSDEQAKVWVAAVTFALSDLPARVAIRAAEDAMHVPMRFLNEVEGVVREKAIEVSARYALARQNLERLMREMAPQPPALPAPDVVELTAEQMQQQVDEMPEHLRTLGLKAGWLVEVDGVVTWNPQEETKNG